MVSNVGTGVDESEAVGGVDRDTARRRSQCWYLAIVRSATVTQVMGGRVNLCAARIDKCMTERGVENSHERRGAKMIMLMYGEMLKETTGGVR